MKTENIYNFGLYLNGTWICNAIPLVTATYAKPGGNALSPPDIIDLNFTFENGNSQTVSLPISKLTVPQLKKHLPLLLCPAKHVDSLQHYIIQLVQDTMPTASFCSAGKNLVASVRGYYFQKLGWQTLPSGQSVYVLGDQVVGDCPVPFKLDPQIASFHVSLTDASPFQTLVPLLEQAPPQVTLTYVYVLMSCISSFLMEQDCDFQGILQITGPSGVGKSTLAKRMTDWFVDSVSDLPALTYEASSSQSGLGSVMEQFRDLPALVDDFCISASTSTQQKRADLANNLIRDATNHTTIVKRGTDGIPVRQQCFAHLIFTSEFDRKEESEVTRCVYVPINQLTPLPTAFSSQLVGSSMGAALVWLARHTIEATSILHTATPINLPEDCPRRAAQNLQILNGVLQILKHITADAGCNGQGLSRQFQSAVQLSLHTQNQLLRRIRSKKPQGSLAEILLDAYSRRDEIFDLTDNVKKLCKHDGTITKHGDLCLRRPALELFIHNQPGYQTIPLSRIVQQLKDMGALVIQEDSSATVHLRNGKNIPRVYRIRPLALHQQVQKERGES